MSLIRNKAPANQGVETNEIEPLYESEQNPGANANSIVPQEANGSHRLKVLLKTNLTGEELNNGHVVKLSDYMDKDCNVVVNEIGTSAIGSNVPTDVLASMNVFNTRKGPTHYKDTQIKNANGWLAGDMTIDPNTGFQPIVNIMPNEYARGEHTHYKPESLLEDRLVRKYGGFSNSADLMQGIVPFPGEPYYYVDRNHVVLNVIAKNWEQLGINLPSERLREDKWVKVASSVVDKVVDELQSNVIDQLPFTNLADLSVMFKADDDGLSDSEIYPMTTEFFISYTNPPTADASHETD
tara:strand:- start:731 stop:1618 length:888 start_codon:yes stop_codon:yes gene_type:complete